MKTTVEIGGYEIVIEHLEDEVKVTAMQDGEVIEEFALESSDDSKKGEDLESYDDFEEEEDFESDEDDDSDDDDSDDDDEDEDQMKKGKMQSQAQAQSEPQVQGTLESFQSFINKSKNLSSKKRKR
jgi:phosphopantothenoylcysteine synthetase/decarboxylase